MSTNSGQPLSPQAGKITTQVERYLTGSGQLFEIRRVEIMVLEKGFLKKESYFEVFPPLQDNRVPASVADIRECCVCLGLYHKESVFNCPVCGRDLCRICKEKITTDAGEILVCAACAEEHNCGLVGRIIKKFWTLKD